MHENGDEHVEERAPEPGTREIHTPTSKYERIVLAAAEATRLNEEVRRKGIKLDHKVTLEALKRVDEGKVKGVITQLPSELEAEKSAAGAPRDMLFGTTIAGFERSSEPAEEEIEPEED